MAMDSVVILDGVQFDLERSTKNTIRFQEQRGDESLEPTIGALYIQKQALTTEGHKASQCIGVVVTIQAIYSE